MSSRVIAPREKRDKLLKPNFDNIPAHMAERQQWLVWRLELTDKGKLTKTPYDAKDGNGGSTTEPATWSDLDTAREAYENFDYDGIGYALNGETFVDLDHVLDDDGRLADEYRWIVDSADTYTEISPSGDGLHLYFLGGKPTDVTECKKTQRDGRVVEMYDSGRYATITGHLYVDDDGVLHDEISHDDNGVISDIAARCLRKSSTAANTTDVAARLTKAHHHTDAEVWAAVVAHDDDGYMQRLADGDTSRYRKGNSVDESEVDWAVAKELARYTRDRDQIERIMRDKFAALARPKWDDKRNESTWLTYTIERAAAEQTKVFDWAAKAPSLSTWSVHDGMLYQLRRGRKGEVEEQAITSTPPYFIANIRDVDENVERALVGMMVRGEERQVTVDRAVLLNNRKIVDALAELGGNITTTNSTLVVAYMTDCDMYLGKGLPTYWSTRRMGWVNHAGERLFMPYDGKQGDVRFDPDSDTARFSKPFLEPKGTLEEWVGGIRPARDRLVTFRAAVAAAFLSPMVDILGIQPFTVYLHGDSQSGKTASVKGGGSVYADTRASAGYVGTFADRPNPILRKAAFLHSFPLIIDELQAMPVFGRADKQRAKQENAEDLLYDLSLGHEYDALSREGAFRSTGGSWGLIVLATGEIPITTTNTQQGAHNRVLELASSRFDSPDEAHRMHLFVESHYGTAGRALVEWIKRHDDDELRARWRTFREMASSRLGNGPLTEKLALVAFGDAVAELSVFDTASSWDTALSRALAFAVELEGRTPTATERDTDKQGVFFVSDWLASNVGRLLPDCRGGDVYGRRDGRTVHVINTRLTNAIESSGFNRDRIIKRMAREGIVSIYKEGPTHAVTIGDSRPRCVSIDMDALDEFVSNGD